MYLKQCLEENVNACVRKERRQIDHLSSYLQKLEQEEQNQEKASKKKGGCTKEELISMKW